MFMQTDIGDFTIDHINPHSIGGRSQPENAALIFGSDRMRRIRQRTEHAFFRTTITLAFV